MPAAGLPGEYPGRRSNDGCGVAFSPGRNHPFVDGNKRTALTSAEVFIILNGVRLNAADAALETLALGVADERLSKKDVCAFFREHVTP